MTMQTWPIAQARVEAMLRRSGCDLNPRELPERLERLLAVVAMCEGTDWTTDIASTHRPGLRIERGCICDLADYYANLADDHVILADDYANLADCADGASCRRTHLLAALGQSARSSHCGDGCDNCASAARGAPTTYSHNLLA